MSNLTIGGFDHRTGRPFTYYETTAGGMGARPGLDGISGVHCHMTNSLNTPIEALEYAYPFRVRSYGYRKSSGGSGCFRGGDGLIREIELLAAFRTKEVSTLRSCRGQAGGQRKRIADRRRRDGAAASLEVQCSGAQGRPDSYRNTGRRRLGRTGKA
jgi:N-methylhydantoinase B